jgi:hypothetical protein
MINENVIKELKIARAVAMRNTISARIPECGGFGAIAQALDYVLNELLSGKAADDQSKTI